MKRLVLLLITCAVIDQAKVKTGYLTNCQGIDENGQVVLDQKVVFGKLVSYKPYIAPGKDIIHGEVAEVGDVLPPDYTTQVSSEFGKSPE